MRRIVMSTMALGLLVVPAMLTAQERGPVERARPGMIAVNAAARVLAHRAELGLTAAQVSQLEQIQRRFEEQNRPLIEQLAAVRGEGGRGRMQRPGGPARRGPLTAEQREELRSKMQALTPEQRAEQRSRLRAQRPQLTPEQREQMRARMQEARGRFAELRPVMQRLRENAVDTQEQVRAVLTSDQLAKLRELRPGRGAPVERMRGGRGSPRPGR